jgi:site-specific DNA-methyltransferase (adenine-specific)
MQSKKSNGSNNFWGPGGPGFSSASDDWATPAEVFAALDAEFAFELDVCASSTNAKCTRFFTAADDGLAQSWAPATSFMNPPYGRVIGDWMKKAADEAESGATVVCLVPARTDTVWWHRQVMARASEVRFVSGRLKFGTARAAAPFPSAIVIYRPRCGELQVSAWAPPPKPTSRKPSSRKSRGASTSTAQTPTPTLSRPAAPKTFATKSRSGAAALALAVNKSDNKKLGGAATTYAAQTSCPTSCPFSGGGGCYAETGLVGFTTRSLNSGATLQPSGPYEVAVAEAKAIDAIKVVAGRPLRLHTVGDCATDEAALLVSDASARYRENDGGPVWTYTHGWREVSRESWREVSALASCETAADVRAARARGYATSIVIDGEFKKRGRYLLGREAGAAEGVEIFPCLEQTTGRTCVECRLCFDDEALKERGYTIAFRIHGEPATVKAATKALRTPDDPDRRLTSRELIPRAIAELEARAERVTHSAIARLIDRTPSTVAEMRRRMAAEEAQTDESTSGGIPKTRVRTTRSP